MTLNKDDVTLLHTDSKVFLCRAILTANPDASVDDCQKVLGLSKKKTYEAMVLSGYKAGSKTASKKAEQVVSLSDADIEKKLDIKHREREFAESLAEYKLLYPREMLLEFYDYWREANKGGRKMRFEMQKTWSLELRLKTWAKRSYGKYRDSTSEKQRRDAEFAKHIASKLANP